MLVIINAIIMMIILIIDTQVKRALAEFRYMIIAPSVGGALVMTILP